MRLSKRTEYGLRATVQLARLWPAHYVQSRDLCKLEDLPAKFVESILLALRRGGFLESKVGSGGGYRLSRAPREINIGDVIRRLEGRLSTRDNETPRDSTPGNLGVHLINQRLTDSIDKVLNDITLEDLLDDINRRTSGSQEMYYI
ncbi:MAG: RrF2 family transcriptional regulator [Tepidisphaeraceae bacterium]